MKDLLGVTIGIGAEHAALAHEAGLSGATVARRWPFRFLLSWFRPDADKVGS